jgi:hypothetical protein
VVLHRINGFKRTENRQTFYPCRKSRVVEHIQVRSKQEAVMQYIRITLIDTPHSGGRHFTKQLAYRFVAPDVYNAEK